MHRRESAFGHWLRTGLGPDGEVKFNPWHDPEDGRFTFSGQGNHFGQGHSAEARRRVATLPKSSRSAPRPRRTGGVAQRLQELRRVAAVEHFKQRMLPAEGNRNDAYLDSKGILTVGVGHKVMPQDGLKFGDRISDAQKDAFWQQDSKAALDAAEEQMREARINDPEFLVALADVNFQLGTGWKIEHRETWRLIKLRQYAAAAKEAEDSDWFREDTPNRVRAFQAALIQLEGAERLRRRNPLTKCAVS